MPSKKKNTINKEEKKAKEQEQKKAKEQEQKKAKEQAKEQEQKEVKNYEVKKARSAQPGDTDKREPGEVMKTATSSTNFNYGFPTPGPQFPTPQKVMDHVFFASKIQWKHIREEEQFDFVVIGTGFGGYAFAERTLRNNPKSKILMLERGPFFLPTHFQNLPVPYQKTLGGLSETFPWTLSAKTQEGKYIKWQHGQIPFFGGRSIMWSAWCPRPIKPEMDHWPESIYNALTKETYFDSAEALLNVIPANKIDKDKKAQCSRPIFGVLQNKLKEMLEKDLEKIRTATRVIHAPLAVNDPAEEGSIDFLKFSTPGPILELIDRQRELESREEGAPVKIVTECVVQKIIQQNGFPTALETSRGVLPLTGAKLILGMGCLPATTLVLNSFPESKAGQRFTAHFITSIICRVPRADYPFADELEDLSLAAIYIAGKNGDKGNQWHIQLTALSDRNPEKNAVTAARHMPDVIATASLSQLKQSKDYIVFVCAVLGEMAHKNPQNWFRKNENTDPTTNVTLQAWEAEEDKKTWDIMDDATFDAIETVLSPEGPTKVEYWHPTSPTDGKFTKGRRPSKDQYRVPGLVHEGSTMHIGESKEDPEAVVDLNYQLKGVNNVYVTGTSLWPASGSWNPTMTLVGLAQHLADQLTPKKK